MQWKEKIKKIISKICNTINVLLREFAEKLENGFIEIIKLKTDVTDPKYKNIYYIYLFGKQIYPGKRNIYSNAWVDNNQPIIYFTINRMDNYTRLCIQQWIDVAYHLKADFYFICDNRQLEYFVLRTVIFHGADVKFMSSMRKTLRNIGETLATPAWRKAAYAHISSFYHAKNRNITKFWKIDADDTLLCLYPQSIVKALNIAQNIAERENMSAISLDVWRSRSLGTHWSWGVAYVNDNVNFCNIFENNKDLSWAMAGTYPYRLRDGETNFDWFMTYLKNHRGIKIETFYIENSYFIHWGKFLQYPHMVAAVYIWSKEKLTYPISRYIYQDERAGYLNIAKDCLKIDIGIELIEGLRFIKKYLQNIS